MIGLPSPRPGSWIFHLMEALAPGPVGAVPSTPRKFSQSDRPVTGLSRRQAVRKRVRNIGWRKVAE